MYFRFPTFLLQFGPIHLGLLRLTVERLSVQLLFGARLRCSHVKSGTGVWMKIFEMSSIYNLISLQHQP